MAQIIIGWTVVLLQRIIRVKQVMTHLSYQTTQKVLGDDQPATNRYAICLGPAESHSPSGVGLYPN